MSFLKFWRRGKKPDDAGEVRKAPTNANDISSSSTTEDASASASSFAATNNAQRQGGGAAGVGKTPGPHRNDDKDAKRRQTIFRVTVPEGVNPGEEFQITAGDRIVRVVCPKNTGPGQSLQITVPGAPPGHDAPPGNDDKPGARPRPAKEPAKEDEDAPPPESMKQQPTPGEEEATQLFEVEVPPGVTPGTPFAILAGGVRVLVTCPVEAKAGRRIRFKLPLALTQKKGPQSDIALIKLSYDKDGWTRTIRVSDMKFQWVRMDDKGDVETSVRFDADKSAYVRKLREVDGSLCLVPANQAVVDSKVTGDDGKDLVTYSDIASAQGKSFEDKAQWFKEKCAMLGVDWDQGHMQINIRRGHLLEDSVDAVMSLSPADMRKTWRFEFVGEPGIDAGGLAREWFQLVTEGIFDPDLGLWQSSETNQMCMQINPASELLHDDHHLIYYRFIGRVMGKALFDNQLVAGHMVQYIYKHILGWPIVFKDIKSIDEEFYGNLMQLQELDANGEDLAVLTLDFTATQELMGMKEDVHLVENGADVEVTNDNFPEYLEANLRYRLLDVVRPQLNELLLGFFEVIPEPLLTVFDFQELELLMCGLPEIDMGDWKLHTEYSGDYEDVGADYPACRWFWEVVEGWDQEMKARLLQFVTGTSGVPARGFGVLQGNDGYIRKFTVHGVGTDVCMYPRAHTCFNRIDLPSYETREDLAEKLKLAVTMVATGFDIE